MIDIPISVSKGHTVFISFIEIKKTRELTHIIQTNLTTRIPHLLNYPHVTTFHVQINIPVYSIYITPHVYIHLK